MNHHLSKGMLLSAAVFWWTGSSLMSVAAKAPALSRNAARRANPSRHCNPFAQASFVPLAAPALISRRRARSAGYGTDSHSPPMATALFNKKKKAGGGGGVTKVQVQLLKTITGTGQKGDIVRVTPAFFQNQLKRSQSAKLITDDEVAKLGKDKDAASKAQLEAAERTKELVDEVVSMKRKAGPEGNLFGGVSRKVIMEMLSEMYPEGALEGKQVKVSSVKDEDEKEMTHDIKACGEYGVTVCLGKGVEVEFTLKIEAS